MLGNFDRGPQKCAPPCNLIQQGTQRPGRGLDATGAQNARRCFSLSPMEDDNCEKVLEGIEESLILAVMSRILADTLAQLVPDRWRDETPFAGDFRATQESIFNAGNNAAADETISKLLNAWISVHQPCVFGRASAKKDALNYCIVHETEIAQGDEVVREKIQRHRRSWRRAAAKGGGSGFVILVVSRALATCVPNENVASFAKRLCQLYLRLDEIECDRIYHEQIGLDIPNWGDDRRLWLAGVNYFAAHGDGRWWADHRIPAGIALSVNSVGHLAASGFIEETLDMLESSFPPGTQRPDRPAISTSERALEFAMKSLGAVGSMPPRGTQLIPLAVGEEQTLPRCPFKKLPKENYCTYEGLYHTDETLPSLYFKPDVVAPKGLTTHQLDLTYLFHKHVDNPAFETMSEGSPIRTSDSDMPTFASPAAPKGKVRIVSRAESDRAIENGEFLY